MHEEPWMLHSSQSLGELEQQENTPHAFPRQGSGEKERSSLQHSTPELALDQSAAMAPCLLPKPGTAWLGEGTGGLVSLPPSPPGLVQEWKGAAGQIPLPIPQTWDPNLGRRWGTASSCSSSLFPVSGGRLQGAVGQPLLPSSHCEDSRVLSRQGIAGSYISPPFLVYGRDRKIWPMLFPDMHDWSLEGTGTFLCGSTPCGTWEELSSMKVFKHSFSWKKLSQEWFLLQHSPVIFSARAAIFAP